MLKFHELSPSPNNLKVRMALRFKDVPFEDAPIDIADRSSLIEVSGQELTPIVEDRGIVLNDSEAILQYLDANYPDTPRLFPRLRAGRKACDAWKRRLDDEVAAQWLPAFSYAIKRREDLDEGALKRFREALARLERELDGRDSFHDDPQMAICDLRVAEWAVYALPGPRLLERVRLFGRFAELFGVPEDDLPGLRKFLAPWDDRLG